MSTLPKLVRDQIPEQIRRHGGTPYWHQAGHKQLPQLLVDKLIEEAQELRLELHRPQSELTLQELADLQEVWAALLGALQISPEALEQARLAKLQRCGGFTKRVVLTRIEEPGDPA